MKLHPKEPVVRALMRWARHHQDDIIFSALIVFTIIMMVYGLHLAILDLTQ